MAKKKREKKETGKEISKSVENKDISGKNLISREIEKEKEIEQEMIEETELKPVLKKKSVFIDNKKTSNKKEDGTKTNPFKTIQTAIDSIKDFNFEYNFNLLSIMFLENLKIDGARKINFFGITTLSGTIEIEKDCKVSFFGVHNFRRLSGNTFKIVGKITGNVNFKDVDLLRCKIVK